MVSWFTTQQANSYWQRLLYVLLIGTLSGFAVLMSLWWGESMVSLNYEYERAGENLGLGTRQIKSSTVTIVFAGDVMLGRDVESISKRQLSYDYPFVAMKNVLASADLAIGNLESPLTEGVTVPTEAMVFRADTEWAPALADAGFDLLGLANNHIPNQGERGIVDTIDALDRAQIVHSGAGVTVSAAKAPAYVTRDNCTVAMLAYNDTDVAPDGYFARDDHAGTALMDAATVSADIARAKENSDWVVVMMHSGSEYTVQPNTRQIEFAHAAIDGGADMVIGHHPHVVQSAEVYRGKYIFYSLGNFIFDQMWSMETRQGLALETTVVDDLLTQIRLIPIQIENYSQPHIITDERIAHQVLDRLAIAYSGDSAGDWVVDMSIESNY
ncbi:MAG: CapA family protein [Candidatus Kerfeldbacteria bacterium]|nr:CapA family protein [Candidatus Kerfeldbacteria bacterium]